MDFGDFAVKATDRITSGKGKRLAQKGEAPDIVNAMPVTIKSSDEKKFFCGFSKEKIMPSDFENRTYYIAGHKMAHKMTGIHDPLTVSAMWLGFENSGIVIVSADIIGLTNTDVTEIRNSLFDFTTATNCVSINICCTHNHAGFDTVGYWGNLPKSGKVDSYMQIVFEKIKKVCIDAYSNRKKGDLFVGTAHVPQAQVDAREPIVARDLLTRIRFVPDNGAKEIWLLNYGAHVTSLGGSNTLCSGDYPYFMRETIYELKNAEVLFSVGAIGAVGPGKFSDDNFERAAMQGRILGKAAVSISNDIKLEPEITVLQQQFNFPVDNSVLAFLAMIKVMSTNIVPNEKSKLGIALVSEMTYIKIGSQQILLLPGEIFTEIAYGGAATAEYSATGRGEEINPKTLCKIADDENLMICGVSNDMTGYVVEPNDFILHKTQPFLKNGVDKFGRSHYQETNSLGYSAAKTIADEFEKIIDRVKEKSGC